MAFIYCDFNIFTHYYLYFGCTCFDFLSNKDYLSSFVTIVSYLGKATMGFSLKKNIYCQDRLMMNDFYF